MGVLPTDRLVLGQASGPGNLAVLLGSATGRDGIGGVSVLASAGFGGGDEAEEAAKRPSVQVGDPYEEKRLIEACLELLDAKLVVGIQDLGGAGLVCATSETAARGGVGMDVDVSAVPRREPGMVDYEVMTSESQERMLAIVTGPQLWAGSPRRPRALLEGSGSSTGSMAPSLVTCPRSPSAKTPPSITGRLPVPSTKMRDWRTIPAPCRHRRTAGATFWSCWPIRPGSTASTTISSSAIRWRGPAVTAPSCVWPPRDFPSRSGAWP